MGVLKDIKDRVADLYLKYKLMDAKKYKQPNMFNFNNIKTIAILFDSSEKEDYELLKKYVAYLREYKKKVKVIGFYNYKEVPDFAYSKLEYDFFSIKDLNLIGKPSPIFIEQFLEEEYDLLIDLNLNDHYPLKYMASMSNAKFKAGKYSKKDTKMYDMMIDIEKTKTLKYFLKQIDTYITMLNNPKS